MTTSIDTQAHHDEHHHHQLEARDKVVFGFWIFVLSDFVLFSVLFVSYVVLHKNTYGGAGIHQVATLPYVLLETFLLLTSNLAAGFAYWAVNKKASGQTVFWLIVTFGLALLFVLMGFNQFHNLIASGNSWQRSAFLSSFFGLVGIHWLHVIVGMLWIVILLIQFGMKGASFTMQTRVRCLGIFWNFLNLVWLFIFVIVYLMGAI